MEVALVNFIGSGMITMSSGLGLAVPRGAAANGYAFIHSLSQTSGPAVKSLLESLISDIWSSWQATKVPKEVALQHLQALPDILVEHAPPMGYFVSAFAKIGNSDGGEARAGAALTAETIMRAREVNAFQKAGLSEQLCYFFLHQLFVRMLSRHETFISLKRDIECYLVQMPLSASSGNTAGAAPVRDDSAGNDSLAGDRSPKSQTKADQQKRPTRRARRTTRKTRMQDQPDSPWTADDAPTDSLAIDELEQSGDTQQWENMAQRYRALSVLAGNRGEGVRAARLQLVLGRLLGRLGAQSRDAGMLQEAHDALRAGLEFTGGPTPTGDDRPAQLTDEDVPLAERHSGQLALGDVFWNLGLLWEDDKLSEHAVVTLEALCASLLRERDTNIWTRAHSALGAIYIAQSEGGEAHNQVATLDRAISAFEAAIDGTSKAEAPLDWARTTTLLANIHAAAAVRSGDLEALAMAVEMKHAALDVFEMTGADQEADTARGDLYVLDQDLKNLAEAVERAGSDAFAEAASPSALLSQIH